MTAPARLLAFAFAAVLVAVSLSGCITVFPGRTAVTTDPRASSIAYLPVIAFEHVEDPSSFNCASGTDSRTIFVPQMSKNVIIDIHAHITSVGEPFASNDPRHIDFTVADGEGNNWADIHLKNNDTDKKLTVEGPRPGGWTVTLSWNICNGAIPGVVNADDNFRIIVVVTQPA